MRRFVADACHELRTPLAVRGTASSTGWAPWPARSDVGRAMRRIENEATRMGALVNDLLQLARLDEGRPFARGPST